MGSVSELIVSFRLKPLATPESAVLSISESWERTGGMSSMRDGFIERCAFESDIYFRPVWRPMPTIKNCSYERAKKFQLIVTGKMFTFYSEVD